MPNERKMHARATDRDGYTYKRAVCGHYGAWYVAPGEEPTCLACRRILGIDKPKCPECALLRAALAARDQTIERLQDGVLKAAQEAVGIYLGPEDVDRIDGSGSDSDEVDMTVAEVRQAVILVGDRLLEDAERARDDLAARDADLATEKEIRVKYQGIVYDICNALDAAAGRSVRRGEGVVVEGVVDGVKALTADLATVTRERDRLRDVLAAVASACAIKIGNNQVYITPGSHTELKEAFDILGWPDPMPLEQYARLQDAADRAARE